MKILNITPEELSRIIRNKEAVSHGSNGLVVKLNENELFKFNYKDFILDFFVDENNMLDFKNIGDISKTIEIRKNTNISIYNNADSDRVKMIKLAMNKQKQINHTSLTLGLVYINNYCVGYLLKYHKNMTSLYDYQTKQNLSEGEKKDILNKIEIAMNELLKNYIYLNDFTTHNILYNPTKKEIEIIDLEDSLTCFNERNAFREKEMQERFQKIKNSFFPEQEMVS